MKTVSISRFAGSKANTLPNIASVSFAVSATIIFFTAILLQSEIFAYLCALAALAAIYSLEKKGGQK